MSGGVCHSMSDCACGCVEAGKFVAPEGSLGGGMQEVMYVCGEMDANARLVSGVPHE